MATAVEIPPEKKQPVSSTKIAWPREFDLVLAYCAGSGNAIARLLDAPLDWARFIAVVEHQRVLPHVYASLSQFRQFPPAKTFAVLQSAYREHARRCLWFASELTRICGHLRERGINAVPYKGPVLAQVLYGDVAARQYSDLDILVAPADVVGARKALAEIGYMPNLELPQQHEQAYLDSGYERSFDAEAGRNLLELQWRILPKFYSFDLDVTELVERAVTIRFGDQPIRTLSVEDLFLVLCVHAAKHVWMQLSWLCDIVKLLESPSVDWDAVVRRAVRLGVLRIITVSLLLAEKLLQASLPESLEPLARIDRQALMITKEVIPIIAQSSHYETESMAYFRLMLRLRERRRDRIKFFWRLATTPSVGEWSALSLPATLSPLYHAVRAIRVTKRLLP